MRRLAFAFVLVSLGSAVAQTVVVATPMTRVAQRHEVCPRPCRVLARHRAGGVRAEVVETTRGRTSAVALVVRRGGTLHTHLLGGAGEPGFGSDAPQTFAFVSLVPLELDADPTTPEVLLLVRNPDPTVIACRLAPVPSCSPAMVGAVTGGRIEVPQATADGFAYGANRVVIRWP